MADRCSRMNKTTGRKMVEMSPVDLIDYAKRIHTSMDSQMLIFELADRLTIALGISDDKLSTKD